MANQPIPTPSAKVLNNDGTMTTEWYEFLKAISISNAVDVKLTGLANGETLLWDAAQRKWVNGAN